MSGALKNIRVLDLSRVLAGPVCTQILGDMGADVLKIEKPGAGDDTRSWGPPFLKDADGNNTTESAYYLSANRNKRSVAIDISTPEGQALIHRLLVKSDVLIENFKTGNLTKYGLDYAQLKDLYPQLIYCSITGFGQNGPLSSEPGYDFIVQGMGGFMAATGGPDANPTKAGVAVSDYVTGLYAAIGILGALNARHATGRGQHVDCALLDSTIAMMTNLAQYYLTSGTVAPRVGNAHSTIVPYQDFTTADGHVIVAVGNDHQFRTFVTTLGQPALADDIRFVHNRDRLANRAALLDILNPVMATRTTDAWVDLLRDVDVPVGPILKMDKVFAQPQVAAREMIVPMTHPLSPTPINLVGSPFKLSAAPAEYKIAPPTLGQHTREVLSHLIGLSDDEIDALTKAGTIA